MYKIKISFGAIFADVVLFILYKISNRLATILEAFKIGNFSPGKALAFPFKIIGVFGKFACIVLTIFIAVSLLIAIIKRIRAKKRIKEVENNINEATTTDAMKAQSTSGGGQNSALSNATSGAVDILKKLSGF